MISFAASLATSARTMSPAGCIDEFRNTAKLLTAGSSRTTSSTRSVRSLGAVMRRCSIAPV